MLDEPVLTCQALYEAASEHIQGHDLAFVDDDQGNTIGHQYPRPHLDVMQNDRDEINVLRWERADAAQE